MWPKVHWATNVIVKLAIRDMHVKKVGFNLNFSIFKKYSKLNNQNEKKILVCPILATKVFVDI